MISYIVNNIGEKKLGEKARYFIEFLDENPEVTLLELLGHKRIGNKTKVFKINFKYKDIEEVRGNKYVTGTLIELVDIEKELQKIINKNKLNYYKYLKNMGLFFKFSEDFIIKNLKNIMMTTYFTENRMISKLMVEEYIDEMVLSNDSIKRLYDKLGEEFMNNYFTKEEFRVPSFYIEEDSVYKNLKYRYVRKIPNIRPYSSTYDKLLEGHSGIVVDSEIGISDIESQPTVKIVTDNNEEVLAEIALQSLGIPGCPEKINIGNMDLVLDDGTRRKMTREDFTKMLNEEDKPSFSLRGLGITPESILANRQVKFDIDGIAHHINKLVEKQMDEKEKTYVVDCLSNLYDSVSNENKSEEDK